MTATTPALQVRYAIVSCFGWWQSSETGWGSPYSAKLWDDPTEALQELHGLGWGRELHLATVVVERRQ